MYRAPSNGVGREELLYRHAGFGGISNLGWSADGRFLSFSDLINISGAMYVLPLDGSGNAREVLRPPLFNARISPDGRVIAYPSNLSGRPEIYIRPFDASSRAAAPPPGEPWQVSRDGAVGGGHLAAGRARAVLPGSRQGSHGSRRHHDSDASRRHADSCCSRRRARAQHCDWRASAPMASDSYSPSLPRRQRGS